MALSVVAATDIGQHKEQNEDSVLTVELDGATVLAVADGMGGHAAGDVASETALDAFEASLGEGDLDEPESALETAVAEANAAVNEAAAESAASGRSMGTTLVAALLDGEQVRLVNVGDSRAYHVTDDAIEQVTVDQSMVQKLVEEGVIGPEEADDHPQRNVISQALGTEQSVDPDHYEIDLSGTLLLCSDGLPEEVSESEIHELVTDGADLDVTADELIARANDYGGSDNISVVLGTER